MSDVDQIRKGLTWLAGAIARTAPEEIDCDELLSRVAGYLEAVEDQQALSPELDAVRHHLGVCPDCAEEFDALLRVSRGARGG